MGFFFAEIEVRIVWIQLKKFVCHMGRWEVAIQSFRQGISSPHTASRQKFESYSKNPFRQSTTLRNHPLIWYEFLDKFYRKYWEAWCWYREDQTVNHTKILYSTNHSFSPSSITGYMYRLLSCSFSEASNLSLSLGPWGHFIGAARSMPSQIFRMP